MVEADGTAPKTFWARNVTLGNIVGSDKWSADGVTEKRVTANLTPFVLLMGPAVDQAPTLNIDRKQINEDVEVLARTADGESWEWKTVTPWAKGDQFTDQLVRVEDCPEYTPPEIKRRQTDTWRTETIHVGFVRIGGTAEMITTDSYYHEDINNHTVTVFSSPTTDPLGAVA